MSKRQLLVMVTDDNESMREGMGAVVAGMGHRVLTRSGGRESLESWRQERPDLLITDLRMEGVDGMDLLKAVRSEDPDALVMLVTAYGTVDVAVEAMKQGAFDFITKPFKPDLLRVKVKSAQEVLTLRREGARLRDENVSLREELGERVQDEAVVGEAESFRRALECMHKVARTDSAVLVTGESGTGKELVARLLHLNSPRRGGPFISVNCAALPDELLESELFGHEKGAFTGAIKRRLGRFELASGGTLFLDEIGDISPALQVKLLRVLQEKEFERVGGVETVRVDVRVVSATNRNLVEGVQKGTFREDLFYRLHVVPVHLPALRERVSDIPLLVDHFIGKLAGRTRTSVRRMSPEALEVLKGYSWPGNVRELENVMEQVLVFGDEEVAGVELLPSYLFRPGGLARRRRVEDAPVEEELGRRSLPELMDSIEKRLVLQAFSQAGGVKTETARILGIKTSALYYKLEKYGIEQGGEKVEAGLGVKEEDAPQ